MFKTGQCLILIPGILTGTMAKNRTQIAPIQPASDELKAQQQLARVVSEVVRELEDGVTQSMLNVCQMLDI
jgi:hypothetical protein